MQHESPWIAAPGVMLHPGAGWQCAHCFVDMWEKATNYTMSHADRYTSESWVHTGIIVEYGRISQGYYY